jgi:hypothetical protein
MTKTKPAPLNKFSLAIRAFFAVLSDRQFAARVRDLCGGEPGTAPPGPSPAEQKASAPPLRDAAPDGALLLLGLLQREARFMDFVHEDVAAYADAEIGAAARVVHEGCRKVLADNFTISPVREEAEGSRVTLPVGFDAAAIRVIGNVVGQPPFDGSIVHRGWRVVDTRLPKLAGGHELSIVAPAEVEL